MKGLTMAMTLIHASAIFVLGVLVLLALVCLYAAWVVHEEQQADRAAKVRFDRIMQASQPPRASGYPSRRIG